MKQKRTISLFCLAAALLVSACTQNSQQQSSSSAGDTAASDSGLTSSSTNPDSSTTASSIGTSSSTSASSSTVDDPYYAGIDWTLKGAALKTALFNKIKTHTAIGYGALYDAYKKTDVHVVDGKEIIWDMYSSCKFTPGTDENHSSYTNEGDNYNREHTIPQSIFNSKDPMYSDLFHIYPTDSYVNNKRSNYPHGVVKGTASYTSSNGCKLGTSDPSTGYSSTVFEVIDEYKGDFARTYFYFGTCYEDKMAGLNSFDAFAKNTYPSLSTWAKNLYLKWAKDDPVSEKEINRNKVAYSIQKNRNPFIDHPEAAEAIWGA